MSNRLPDEPPIENRSSTKITPPVAYDESALGPAEAAFVAEFEVRLKAMRRQGLCVVIGGLTPLAVGDRVSCCGASLGNVTHVLAGVAQYLGQFLARVQERIDQDYGPAAVRVFDMFLANVLAACEREGLPIDARPRPPREETPDGQA